jgi:HK97 family phage major capsid protein
MTTKELREKRAKLVADARGYYDTAIAEASTEAQRQEADAKFDSAMAEADQLGEQIARAERLEDSERALTTRRESRAARENRTISDVAAEEVLEFEAFVAYCKFGMNGISDHLRPLAARHFGPLKAAQSTIPAEGGYTVPQEFMYQLETAMLAFGGMRAVASNIKTDSGALMPYPTSNDATNEGAIIAENTQVTEQDAVFGAINLGAFMYTSKLVRISLQLLQDSAFDLPSWLAQRLGERLARITNRHFTVGAGGGALPMGIVTAATAGPVGSGSVAGGSVTYDNLVDTEHSVDPAYRANGKWMFHDSTLRDIKKLKDLQGRPIWIPGLIDREPDRILGYPYQINQHMAVPAVNAKTILFGDLSKYLIRDVLGVQVLRLNERYADYLQVGFLAFLRADGNLIDAGTHPVKYFSCSATALLGVEGEGATGATGATGSNGATGATGSSRGGK